MDAITTMINLPLPNHINHRQFIVNSKNKEAFSPLGFDPDLSGPVGTVSNRTGYALLETVPTKRENGRCGILTAPVWSVSLILRSTIFNKFYIHSQITEVYDIEVPKVKTKLRFFPNSTQKTI